MRSHITVMDWFPAEPFDRTTRRDMGRDPAEVVTDETFYGSLLLRNFERWQVGLLALMLSRVNIADVQIGAHRSEGMGSVAVRYSGLSLIYPGAPPDAKSENMLRTRLCGAGQFA